MLLIKNLLNFGLSEKEARIYISVLELETAAVSEIAKKSGVNRSSVYVVIESLKKRGLINTASTNNVTKYIATTPDQLLRLAKETKDKYILLKQNLNALLPELKKINKEGVFKPKIVMYSENDGIIKSLEDTLTTKEHTIRVCSSARYPIEKLNKFFVSYLYQRQKQNLKMSGIHPDNKMIRKAMEYAPKNFDEMILISEKKFKFPSDIAIYDDKIGFMSTNEAFGVKIESKDMSNTLKTLFDLAREEARRLSKSLNKEK